MYVCNQSKYNRPNKILALPKATFTPQRQALRQALQRERPDGCGRPTTEADGDPSTLWAKFRWRKK